MRASAAATAESTAVSSPRNRSFGFFDRASFVSRSDLFANPDRSTLMVVVEVVKPGDGLASRDRDALMAELEDTLAEVAGTGGSCFRLRKAELCVLVPDVDLDYADAVLDEVAAAARGTTALLSADALVGEVVVPDEANDPRTALRVADQRLKAQRRERGIERTGLIIGRRDPSGAPKTNILSAFFREGDRVSLVYEVEPTVKLGDVVRLHGSRAYVRAFSPMSLPDGTVELEDVDTGRRFSAARAEVEPDSQALEA